MMQVDTASVVGLFPRAVQPDAIAPRGAPAVSGRAASSDSIQISDAAHTRAQHRIQQVRADRIERVRQQIAEGTYATDERVTAAAAALGRALSRSD